MYWQKTIGIMDVDLSHEAGSTQVVHQQCSVFNRGICHVCEVTVQVVVHAGRLGLTN
jgi:hypothetical protein